MVRQTLKLQDFKSMSDHFGTLCIKGLNATENRKAYLAHFKQWYDSKFGVCVCVCVCVCLCVCVCVCDKQKRSSGTAELMTV